MSTTEFIDRFTTAGGTVLQAKPDGTCIFLDAGGCAVHADRPLVCRLYPLGRTVDFLGVEDFSQMESEEGCQGMLHESGTIEQYLEDQGALPFMRAADRYLDLLWYLLETLKEQDLESSQYETILDAVRAVTDSGTDKYHLLWIDMDRVLADDGLLSDLPVPASLEEKMAMHIKAVRAWTE